jgi:hypothetical protein
MNSSSGAVGTACLAGVLAFAAAFAARAVSMDVVAGGEIDLSQSKPHIFTSKTDTPEPVRKALADPGKSIMLYIDGVAADGLPQGLWARIMVFLHDDKATEVHSLHFAGEITQPGGTAHHGHSRTVAFELNPALRKQLADKSLKFISVSFFPRQSKEKGYTGKVKFAKIRLEEVAN